MPSLGRMCYLTTVRGPFHGRVVAARLGAEGVMAVLRGVAEGLGPLESAVDVLVLADQLQLAREILLADEVEDAFESMNLDDLAAATGSSPGWYEHPEDQFGCATTGVPEPSERIRAGDSDDGAARKRRPVPGAQVGAWTQATGPDGDEVLKRPHRMAWTAVAVGLVVLLILMGVLTVI